MLSSNINNEIISEEQIFDLFEKYTEEQIKKEFDLPKLRSMYEIIYLQMPPKSRTKIEIIEAIKGLIYSIKRVEGFKIN